MTYTDVHPSHHPSHHHALHRTLAYLSVIVIALALVVGVVSAHAESTGALTRESAQEGQEEVREPLWSVEPLIVTQSSRAQPRSLKVGLFTQAVSALQHTQDKTQASASLYRARSALELHWGAPSDQRYQRLFLQNEWVGETPKLLDAELEVSWRRELKLQLGYYRPFFARSWRTGVPVLSTPGRGEVSDTFHPKRATGATLMGELFEGQLEYALSAFDEGSLNGQGVRAPRYAARVAWNPLGVTPYTQTPWTSNLSEVRLSVGAQVMADHGEDVILSAIDTHTEGLDVTVLSPRVAWLNEAFSRSGRDEAKGASTQLGALLAHLQGGRQLDASVRAGLIRRPQQRDRLSVEGSLGYLFQGHHAKLLLHAQRSSGGGANELEAPPAELKISLFGQLLFW